MLGLRLLKVLNHLARRTISSTFSSLGIALGPAATPMISPYGQADGAYAAARHLRPALFGQQRQLRLPLPSGYSCPNCPGN